MSNETAEIIVSLTIMTSSGFRALLQSIAELQEAVAYIDWKQDFYDDVLSGKTAYYSNLVPELMKR